jgi:CcmD family protein
MRSIIRIRTAVVAAALALVSTAIAFAQAQEGFTKMSPEDMARESLPAAPLVYTAYAIVWLGIAIYVFTLWRRLGRVERDLADVQSRLAGRR